MLKITTVDSPAEQRLIVEGKLAGPGISELELAWNRAQQANGNRRILIDLSGATLIDPEAEGVLLKMIAAGARLTAKGVYCEYVVSELISQARRTAQAHRR